MPARVSWEIDMTPEPALIANSYFTAAKKAKTLIVPVNEAVDDIFIPEIDFNFFSQGRPEHWAPLAPATIRQRTNETLRAAGVKLTSSKSDASAREWEMGELGLEGLLPGGMKILIRSGALMEGATSHEAWKVTMEGREAIAAMYDPTGYGHFHLEDTMAGGRTRL